MRGRDEEARIQLDTALLAPIEGMSTSESAERQRRENEMALFMQGAAALGGG